MNDSLPPSWLKMKMLSFASDDQPDWISRAARHRRKPDRELRRKVPFRSGRGRKRQRCACVEHDHRGEDRSVVGEPDVGAVAASEEPPVESRQLIPLPGVTV